MLTRNRKAYETLTNRIPALLNSKTTIGQKETREANPNVKYWTRQEWTAANVDRVADLEGGTNPGTRGRTRAAQGINVNMKYLEDKEGVPISGHLASDVRRHARAVFVGLAQKGSLFSSWTEADHTSLKLYYSEMAERFEELRLCANDWKAEMIALDIYRTWREQWQKKQKKVDKDIKIEVLDVNMDDTDNSEDEGPQKHSIDQALNEDQRAAKKAKSGNVQDLPAAIRPAYVPVALQHMQAVSYLFSFAFGNGNFFLAAYHPKYQYHTRSPRASSIRCTNGMFYHCKMAVTTKLICPSRWFPNFSSQMGCYCLSRHSRYVTRLPLYTPLCDY